MIISVSINIFFMQVRYLLLIEFLKLIPWVVYKYVQVGFRPDLRHVVGQVSQSDAYDLGKSL